MELIWPQQSRFALGVDWWTQGLAEGEAFGIAKLHSVGRILVTHGKYGEKKERLSRARVI
jgi:hypothetical protein